MSTSTAFYDHNGNNIPVSIAIPTRSNFDYVTNLGRHWHCNSDPHKTAHFEQPAPTPEIFPEYKGGYQSRMEEWSFPRTRNQVTNPEKFYANKLNESHAAFSLPMNLTLTGTCWKSLPIWNMIMNTLMCWHSSSPFKTNWRRQPSVLKMHGQSLQQG
jgi:hypothetical protein